jgi:hypothetical protein
LLLVRFETVHKRAKHWQNMGAQIIQGLRAKRIKKTVAEAIELACASHGAAMGMIPLPCPPLLFPFLWTLLAKLH